MPVLNIEGTVVSVLPTEGINTYRIQPIIMKGKDADAVIAELKRKIETKEELTKADLLPLVLECNGYRCGGDSESRGIGIRYGR